MYRPKIVITNRIHERAIDLLRERCEVVVNSDLEPWSCEQRLEEASEATGMIAFQISEEGHDHYGRIDPFWDWLFVHYAGLLQIDDEGYYNQDDQVLEVE